MRNCGFTVFQDVVTWLDAGKSDVLDSCRAIKPGATEFRGVSEKFWDYQIDGYQDCHKWLNDRNGRTFSVADIIL